MEKYLDISGNSGIESYAIGVDFIKVKFKNGLIYLYTNEVTGKNEIAQMKQLAKLGKGLSTFISQHVKEKYAEKENPT